MRLKRVKIFGFKTFADKAEFDIDGDLIAVVGPNGCGKSNLVDAILWGLGEGNARNLRAQNGADVIFNGSSKRKPVGYAEVALYFDNEDGSLPVSTSEVVVARRVTRSGDSDYSINRQSCRLRDVLELLADSGLGRAGYSIVSQKEIDSALAASAEDRRAWVDEAAGVQRYRARKTESLRRLASARDHLARVADILREIEAQREPLREEAEVARRFKIAIGALREIESGLLVLEAASSIREVQALEARIDSASKVLSEESRRLDEVDAEIQRIGEHISQIESEMDTHRATQQGALTQAERAEAAKQLAEQRLVSFDELESSLGEETKFAEERRIQLESEIALLEQEVQVEESAFREVAESQTGASEAAQNLRVELAEVEAKLVEAKKKHERQLKLEAEASQRSARRKELQREWDSARVNLPSLESGANEARTEWEQVQAKVASVEAELQALRARATEEHRASNDAAQRQRTLLAEHASLEGRKRGLESTLETHEGLAHGAREVLSAVQSGRLSGSFVPVGEAIDAPKTYAIAIETALGSAANDLIVETESDAKRAIEFLKTERAGRATFQPIPLMKPVRSNPDFERALRDPSVLGAASDLVECSDLHRPVVNSLLGRVIVIRTIDDALRMAKTSGWSRMVTLDGESIHHSGSVTGGKSQKAGYGMVQRRADLLEIESKLDDLEATIAVVEKEVAGAEALGRVLQDEEAAVRLRYSAEIEAEKDARKWAASVTDEFVSTQRAIAKLETELSQIDGIQVEEIEAIDLAAIEQDRDQAYRRYATLCADAEQSVARVREAESRRAAAAVRLEAAKGRLRATVEGDSARGRRFESLAPERDRARLDIEEAKLRIAETNQRRTDVESSLLSSANAKREQLEKSFQLSEEAKAIRSNVSSAGEAAHHAEIARARAESKRANALQRLIEEYGMGEEEALEQEPSIQLPPDAAQAASRLRREVKSMGDVNVGAIEAYERLTSRADELDAQSKDIEGGIQEVEASIRELDKLTRDRFHSTFEAVQEHFSEMFVRLFPGGEGALRLTEPDNSLESGIEIDVQLPGKKVQRLELLSGGERSLCATAFLFALLKAKPSPLVVLDEVDAPLDGRNVERFVELLHDFAGKIQFVVITHNPTTIESAPVWLGITMSEPGVSTIVPARVRIAAPPAMLA